MTMHNPALLPKVRSRSIMQAMQHMPCTLRVSSFYPGHKCSGPDTVVGCHLPVDGKGVSTKVSDLSVAAGCQHCHDIVDRRDKLRSDFIIGSYPTAYADRLLRGHSETLARLVGMGLIAGEDWEII